MLYDYKNYEWSIRVICMEISMYFSMPKTCILPSNKREQ